MGCPKCGKEFLRINGSFQGHQDINFAGEDGLEVMDSEPTDFDWDDHDTVECLECGHTGPVVEFQIERESDEG